MALIKAGCSAHERQICSLCHALILPCLDDSTISESFINSSLGPSAKHKQYLTEVCHGHALSALKLLFLCPLLICLQAWAASMQPWWNGDISFNIESNVGGDVFNLNCGWLLSWHTGAIDCGFVGVITLFQDFFECTRCLVMLLLQKEHMFSVAQPPVG